MNTSRHKCINDMTYLSALIPDQCKKCVGRRKKEDETESKRMVLSK